MGHVEVVVVLRVGRVPSVIASDEKEDIANNTTTTTAEYISSSSGLLSLPHILPFISFSDYPPNIDYERGGDLITFND